MKETNIKGNDKPFEGCLFWHAIGFIIDNNIERPTNGSLYLKINKRFDADLGTTISKENINKAKDQIISELAKEVELAFKNYLLEIEKN
jgi:hypothetical protein|nr:MAG TPA: YjbD family protein [Caudoviricetes sp.]